MKKEEFIALKDSIIAGEVQTFRDLLNTIELFKGEYTINHAGIATHTFSDGSTSKYVDSLLHLIMVHEIRNKTELVEALLEKGADPNINDGYIPSSAIDYPEVFKLLRNAGGKLNLNDMYLDMPYIYDPKTIIRIIDAGANPDLIYSDIISPRGDKHEELHITKMLNRYLQREYNFAESCRYGVQDRNIDFRYYASYPITRKLIQAGADVNAEYRIYEIDDNGLINEAPIAYYTTLYKAMQGLKYGTVPISLICDLLEAGADPTIPTHDSDNALKLALRLEGRYILTDELSSLCSYLFKQDSLISLSNIAFFTLEALRFTHEIHPAVIKNNQTEGWEPNISSLVEHVKTFHDKIHKAEGTGQEIYQEFINKPGKLYKSLEAIKNFQVKSGLLNWILNGEIDKTSWAANKLLDKPFQASLHDSLSSMIRIYSEKYTQNFPDSSNKVKCIKPSIGGELKASVISFLPPEEQWDAIMLSKGGLEDPFVPTEPEIDLSKYEQEIIGFDIPICNVM